MVSPKARIAAAVKHVPFALRLTHSLWRLTRPRFTAGVIGVLFNPLGEVLLVEHVFHTYPQWGLPGGYIDRNEHPQDALAREMREELDLSVEVGHALLIERAYRDHLDIAYLCRSSGSVGRLSGELLAYRWFSTDQLPEIRPFHRKAIVQAHALQPLALTEVSV